MAVYAFSDIHGCGEILSQIQKFLDPTDVVYFLGDACDRGPQPFETLKEIARDSRFIFLKGNHEDMLIRAIDVMLDVSDSPYAVRDCINNGGAQTLEDYLDMSADSQMGWYRYIERLPTYASYINAQGKRIFMTHSGADEWSGTSQQIWDRDHFLKEFNSDYDIIVHGHTPTPYLFKVLPDRKEFCRGAMWYSQDRKVDIDLGTANSGYALLLNLDDFSEIIFNHSGIVDFFDKGEK